MKRFKYFFLALASLALAASCTQKEEPFEPGEPDVAGCYGVYFPVQDATGSHTYDPTMPTTVEFTVKRTNSSGAITVPVSYTESEAGIFQVGTLSFADGQEETTLKVDFPNAEMGTNYSLSLLIDDPQYVSKYADSPVSIDFSVLRVEWQYVLNPKTKEPANVTFYSNWNDVNRVCKVQYYEVDGVRYCHTVDENPFMDDEGNTYTGYFGNGDDDHLNFIWYTKSSNPDGNNYIEVPMHVIGYNSSRGADIIACDYFHYYYTLNGITSHGTDYFTFAKWADAGNEVLPYYDGNGGFFLTLAYPIGTTGYWYGDYEDFGIVEGFVRTDYSFEVSTDYSSDGATPVYMTAGADIAKVKYAVYEGSLKPAQIAEKISAISEGTEETEEFTAFEYDEEEEVQYGSFTVSPETTGDYTIVLVAFDAEDKAQNSASATFRFIAPDDADEYSVDINVFTEATPDRYRELKPYNSFAYGVYGSNLTDVHLGIFAESTITKNGMETVLDVLKNNSSYAVTEEMLGEINADGGYYDVATGVTDETKYYVIAWATNGDLDDYAMATFTTEPLPYVWNYLGKAKYTDDVACGLYGIEPITVDVNLYEEESHPGLFKMEGHQLALVNEIFGEDMTEYEGGNWVNVPLIVDATNPESVVIELQNYGVMLNSSDGMIDGITNMYNGAPFSIGTYKDGVIAFPTPKGMLCTLDGDGYYYANQNGAFKIVLPDAVSEEDPAAGTESVKFDVNEANKSLFAPKPEIRYERDPQPVQVKSGSFGSLRAPKAPKTIEKAEKAIR